MFNPEFNQGIIKPNMGILATKGTVNKVGAVVVGPDFSPFAENYGVVENAHFARAKLKRPLDEWEQNKKKPGENVVELHVGKPGEGTLSTTNRAAIEVWTNQIPEYFSYPPVEGPESTRLAVAEHLKRAGINASADRIITNGPVKLMLNNIAQALATEGGRLSAVFSPGYPGHLSAALKAGRGNNGEKPSVVALPVRKENGFKPDPKETEDILFATKPDILWICNPMNPTGQMLDRRTASPFVKYLKENPKALAVEDIIYWPFDFTNGDSVFLSSIPESADRTIAVGGPSKYGFWPGARFAFSSYPEQLIELRSRVIRQLNDSHAGGPMPTSIILEKGLFSPEAEAEVRERVDMYDGKIHEVYNILKKEAGLQVYKPTGAFYIAGEAPEDMPGQKFPEFLAAESGTTAITFEGFSGGYDNKGRPMIIDARTKDAFLPKKIADNTIRFSCGGKKEDLVAGAVRIAEAMNAR